MNVGGPKQRQRTLGEGTVGDVKKDIKGLFLSVDMHKSGTKCRTQPAKTGSSM